MSTTLTGARLDYVNMGLMVIALVLAFFLPFELFLFSYAVLGPLHYVTEISWLHQRNYFSTLKKDFWLLVAICLIISFFIVYHDLFVYRKLLSGVFTAEWHAKVMKVYMRISPAFIFSAFCTAIAMVFSNSWKVRLLVMILSFSIIVPLYPFQLVTVWIGVFLPTLVHVFLFTGLFILYGALKSNNVHGYLSLLVFASCAGMLFFISYIPEGASVGQYVRNAMNTTGFSSVNAEILKMLKGSDGISSFDLFESRRGYTVQRFIAFAYTYHYLNWFSKTEVIKWHMVPKPWLVASVVVWISAVALYWVDYRTGLIALFFLSLLHVFLEFPLNIKSIKGIVDETQRLLRLGKVA
ncbi:MAG: hypothetical protein MUF42_09785 [Cytophagaceae bacterium]|jgi:hypothetical protein|nr:hypothetical protein [Cytophagaceae bacterium]